MKLKFEKEIDAGREAVWLTFNDPAQKQRWQQQLLSFEHKDGVPGQPGAVSELTFDERNGKLVVQETITERRDPDFLIGSYESKHATMLAVNHFEIVNERATRWTAWCKFRFRGVMKLMSHFAAAAIRERTEGDMERFKLLVESREAQKAK